MDKSVPSFSGLVGQTRVKTVLAGIARNERLAGGYIFAGPAGCGKTTAAKAFFQLLTGVQADKSTDYLSIDPDETRIKIDVIRELKMHIQYGPSEQKCLLVVIQRAERLVNEAANAFLKVLEEPPVGVTFILETAQPDSLLKTIQSRCQKIPFDQLSVSELKQLGLEQVLSEDAVKFLDFAKRISQKNLVEIFNYAEEFARTGKDEVQQCLELWLQDAKSHKDISRALLIKGYLKILQKNVNLKLTLDTLFMKLKEQACQANLA